MIYDPLPELEKSHYLSQRMTRPVIYGGKY